MRRWLVGAMLWLTAGYAIALSGLQLLDSPTVYPDSRRYVHLVMGEPEQPPFRYRVLVPALARLIPDRVVTSLTIRKNPTPVWLAQVKLCLLNALFLSLTGWALWLLLVRLDFSDAEALLGSVVFYLMRPTIQFGSTPMVDPASWFLIALGAACLVRRQFGWLSLVLVAGAVTKETTFILVPLALLLPERPKIRELALIVLPGLTVLLALRFVLGAPWLSWVEPARVGRVSVTIGRWFTPSGLHSAAGAFGLLWVPAVIGYRNASPLLRRWTWVLVPMLVLMFWLGTNLGRLLFLAFPAVIPLALVGMRRLEARLRNLDLIARVNRAAHR